MKIMSTFVAISLTLALSSTTFAHHRSHGAWAKVVDVQPVYQIVRTRTPERHCWTETVATEVRSHDRAASTLVGGLIGGTIGHSAGHGHRNKHLGAAVGTIVGMAIGSEIGRDGSNRSHVEYREIEHCKVRHVRSRQRELVAYDVVYRYRGRLHRTSTAHHPGKRIKIAKSVRTSHH